MSRYSHNIHLLITVIAFLLVSACQSVPEPQPQLEVETPAQIEPQATAQEKPVEIKPDPAQELYQRALTSAKKGKFDRAIQQFEELLKMEPEFKSAYTNLGLLRLQKQQQKEAKQAFENAIKQDKSDAIAYNHLAIIQRQEGLFKPALENYTKAINADPDYANAYLNLGILLDLYMQDLPRALEQYLMFQKLTGDNNEQVQKWVLDIKRRIEEKSKKAKG